MMTQLRAVPAKTDPAIPGPPRGTVQIDVTALKRRLRSEVSGTVNPSGRPVVLFPDTFNNYLHASVGVARVEALEAAGWRVIMPRQHVCCGRPLYDYGFLGSAQRYLNRVLDVLRPYVRDDVLVVGTEPSCLAVFKDELRRMLPHGDDAARLARNAYHFGEFFTTFGVEPPRLDGSALLWGTATSGRPAESSRMRSCCGRWD